MARRNWSELGRHWAVGVCAAAAAWGCQATQAPGLATVEGASHITLRCVNEGPDGGLVGLPLDGCGCSVLETGDAGVPEVRHLGRVECACEVLNGSSLQTVDFVAADPATCTPVSGADGCQTGWSCPPVRGEDGDWLPSGPPANVKVAGAPGCPAVLERPVAVACSPMGGGQVRAYVSSAQNGRVSVLDLTAGDPTDADKEPKRVLDVDSSVPGVTTLYVDDVVTDIDSHPDGRFLFTVNSSTGHLSIFFDERAGLRPAVDVDLAAGPLLEVAVWPPVDRPAPSLNIPPRAYVTAPVTRQVLEVDLDAAAAGLDPVLRVFSPLAADGSPAAPGRIAVSADGTTLVVGHALESRITVYDLVGGAEPRAIVLAGADRCNDAYLSRVATPVDDRSCADALDNDGDGLVDAADPDCSGAAPTEALNPLCPKISECADGADNDGDGLIDAEDDDCDPAAAACAEGEDPQLCLARQLDWERPLPACDNGLDDDGDGLIDRADPGCATQGDDDETDGGDRFEVSSCAADPSRDGCERATCADGVDNDGDGKVDLDDPDCAAVCSRAPCAGAEGLGLPVALGVTDDPCRNGLDDDGDGLTDAEDPGCNDFNAATRYGFERRARCADGIDNDRDGATDYPDDPDCFAAADDNEGLGAVAIGPTSLLTAAIPVSTGVRHLLYIIDPNGLLQVVDLKDDALRPLRIDLTATAGAMALRQYEGEASLLVASEDTVLRAVEITGPIAVRTEEGLPVFARIEPGSEPLAVKLLYTVIDGAAVAVEPVEGSIEGKILDRSGTFVEIATDAPRRYRRVEGAAPVPVRNEDANLDRGYTDRMVVVDRRQLELQNKVANVLSTAFDRTSLVIGAPRFVVDGSQAPLDPSRHPVLCRVTDSVAEGEAEICIPAGKDATGATESEAAARSRAPERMEVYEGVVVTEEDADRVFSGRYTLTYEGDLPGTTSRTGLFAGRDADKSWTMVDYEVDYCRRGVEVGDTVIIDRFRAATNALAETETCRALSPVPSQDRTRERDPSRYRVLAVTQHRLILGVDDRTRFCITDEAGVERCQQPRSDRSGTPTLAAPTPLPQYACAAQFITYTVRTAPDQWVLVGDRSGYRHPWVPRGGQCEHDARLVDTGRVSRARYGETLSNEWFRLRVGGSEAALGLREGTLPHMLDARFEFDVNVGRRTRGLADAAVAVGEARWLPNDDRLFLVDTSQETVNEIAGFRVYEEAMRLERILR